MNGLKGLRVLNTRPVDQAKQLSQAIEAAGGVAIECPALVIRCKEKTWLNNLPNLNGVAQAIFISTNAVDCCFKTLIAELLPWPASIQIIAVGEATAAALSRYSLEAHLIPAIADSENLLQLEDLQNVQNKTILLFKGEEGRELIAETLQARGADIHLIEVYKREMPKPNPQQLRFLWQNEVVDIILFTSHQAMSNIFYLFGEEAQDWLCRTPCLVISERLAKEAALLGIKKVIVSTPKSILTTLHQFNQGLIDGQ
ncbi:Uroporphyrinogen-III synthase [Legionella massiliensis]|uniref:Uroporphyrinogen-III synthase n=1 Tax=Legionella massiliensis TaxID=1034943 RepID=A0A078L1N3_9GAMM|nr:uroporphyrinogen-III synthase [Legionella massiliensis]CDZ77928.1 Uroporphyrinogen-III synthase [Legionella massiliensis]CEE13666.1 Uroporphyrinogen-III synthase [Legionella massiliensis]